MAVRRLPGDPAVSRLGSDTLEQGARRLVGRVLRDELAREGTLEDQAAKRGAFALRALDRRAERVDRPGAAGRTRPDLRDHCPFLGVSAHARLQVFLVVAVLLVPNECPYRSRRFYGNTWTIRSLCTA